MSKTAYKVPTARKIDFVYDMQVAAESVPSYDRGEKTQWEWFMKCQAKKATCEFLYHAEMVCENDEGVDFSLRR